MRKALVVDDAPANRDFLVRLLQQAGFEVRGVATGHEAMSVLDDLDDLRLALIDMELPDTNGVQLTYELRKLYPEAYLVVATMHDERSLMERTYHRGGNCFLVKPHGFMELYKRLTTLSIRELCAEEFTVIDQYGLRELKFAARQD